MTNQQIVSIQRWGGRAVAVIGYLSILGMLGAGVCLMGLALLLAVFTRADGTAFAALLSGTLFAATGGLALVWQLRRTYQDLARPRRIQETTAAG